jgi:hypothetical protein
VNKIDGHAFKEKNFIAVHKIRIMKVPEIVQNQEIELKIQR